jgi:thiamine biosynthesis lipoprotein
MGVDVVVGGARAHELEAVQRIFAEWEATFSRFRTDSDLSRVNSCETETVVVSPRFARVLETSLWAARVTDGLVDPTIGEALLAAGYDRDFSQLDSGAAGPSAEAKRGSWRSVRITGHVLSRPPGVLLDLNGVVKGLAVDEASHVVAHGFVAAGGDLATRTEIDAGLPDGGAVRVTAGGLATSGTTRRRWERDGVLRHHLIDPRTGLPSGSRWEQVTVAASTCLEADVAAKAAFLLSEDGLGWLDQRGLPGRFVGAGGVVAVNEVWKRAVSSDSQVVAA